MNTCDILEWKDIYYTVETNAGTKQILNGISGEACCGELIAILGSSGAGKTTLLNILAGRISVGKIDGIVTVNGRRRPSNWVELVGYVEQEDLLSGYLSVKENLEFSASLRLSRFTDEKEIEDKVEETINSLGLEDCMDNLIGSHRRRGISGGQKKRTSIGMELVAESNVLFMDEPTTGLDAFNARNLIETIKKLTVEEAKVVILTIHQPRPDVLMMFDRFFLLTQGRIAYFGTLSDALGYFEEIGYPCPSLVNPADYFIDLITFDTKNPRESQDRIDYILSEWERHHHSAELIEYDGDDITPYKLQISPKPLPAYQLKILLWREWKMLIRELDLLIALVLQAAVLTILVCAVYFQLTLDGSNGSLRNISGALFLVGANLLFSTVMPLTTLFPLNRDLLIREHYANMYHPSLQYAATAIIILPTRLIFAVFFILISYWIIGFRAGCQYFLYTCAFVIILVFTSVAIGLTIGSCFPSVKIVQIFSPLILLIFLFFSGNTADSSTVSWVWRWIQYVSVIYWFFRGVMQVQFNGLVFSAAATPANGSAVLAQYGFLGVGPWFSLLMIATIGVLTYLIGSFCIGKTYRQKTIVI